MRTAIYLGLLYIGSAINSLSANPLEMSENVVTFLVILIFLFLFMDVLEFGKKIAE